MELMLSLLKWSVIVGAAALLLTLFKPLLDRRYSAKWRWGAWLVMAVFLLLAPVRWESFAPRTADGPPVVIEVPKVEVSVSRQEGISFQRPQGTVPPPSVPAVRPAGTGPQIRNRTFPLEELLMTLWIAGAALFLLYHGLGTWFFTRKARRWSRSAGEETLRVYGEVCREMGVRRPPVLRVSPEAGSPMMMGLLRPRLMLPTEDIGERELAFVLRHELTHHRRHDLWYKLALLLANGMHWFNPLIFLLRREAERDLELTCDDAVVARADAETRRAYSETLLASVHRQKGLSRAVLSTHFYGGKEVMKERFRNILGKRGRKWGGLALALVLLGTVAAACTFGVKASQDGALSIEELAEWQEKANAPEELGQYLWCMYTDVSYIPSEECIEATNDLQRSYRLPSVKVVSGTKSGDTVTLELEGSFSSGLSTGTLTLADGEPVSFTTPLYTAVETAAREVMEAQAEGNISVAKEHTSKELEYTEKYITSLSCSESFNFDGKTYYVWELYYRMKPNDIENVVFVGGMDAENGWVMQQQSVGSPVLIFSMDEDGKIVMEEQIWSSSVDEAHYTWEEYVYCHTHLGMENMYGIFAGWPELNTPLLESLRNGRERWVREWKDVALAYLSSVYDVYPEDGFTVIPHGFYADQEQNGHGSAMVVQAVCGDRTVLLLMVGGQAKFDEGENATLTLTVWQVCGEKWEPDRPQTVKERDALPTGELTAGELDAITDYFNDQEHNGLLRYPYSSLGQGREYMGVLFYDLGKSVTDEEERETLAESFFDGEMPDTDCLKLTRDFIQEYLEQNFGSTGNRAVDHLLSDIWMVFDTLKRTGSLPYLENYDAYYMVHGDTMMSNYTFDRAERDEEGVVSLYYTTDLWQYNDEGELDILWDQPMRAKMIPGEDGGWKMLSNQIIE
jgi:beta-lactamase regulating signal transducer with metallopeptidase domain